MRIVAVPDTMKWLRRFNNRFSIDKSSDIIDAFQEIATIALEEIGL